MMTGDWHEFMFGSVDAIGSLSTSLYYMSYVALVVRSPRRFWRAGRLLTLPPCPLCVPTAPPVRQCVHWVRRDAAPRALLSPISMSPLTSPRAHVSAAYHTAPLAPQYRRWSVQRHGGRARRQRCRGAHEGVRPTVLLASLAHGCPSPPCCLAAVVAWCVCVCACACTCVACRYTKRFLKMQQNVAKRRLQSFFAKRRAQRVSKAQGAPRPASTAAGNAESKRGPGAVAADDDDSDL